MQRWFAHLACFALVSTAVGCSKPAEPELGQEGDACTIEADCEEGLGCVDEVCTPKTANNSTNNGTNNATNNGTNNGANNGTNNGVNNTPEDEAYYVSYLLQLEDDTRELHLFDTETGTAVRVSPEGRDCRLGCWLSRDLAHFVYARSNGPAFDIYSAPVDENLQVQGEGQIIAGGVRRIEVVDDVLTYIKEEGGNNNAYLRKLSGGAESLIGRIGSVESTEGDWHVDPSTNTAVLFTASLQTMDVKIGTLEEEVTDTTFTINSENYQEVSGSYFGGQVPTAISDDGKYMALVTQKAPLDTNYCESASECLGPGERCGRFNRCASIQVAVHFFDMENLDNLGEACSSDEACGPVHTCDIPDESRLNEATCIPRRVVLGLPAQQMQGNPSQTGCMLTDGLEDLHYTEVRSPLSFGPDGSLYLVAARSCGEFNIEDSDILRLSPTSTDYQMVWGPEDSGYDASKCYDDVESKIDVTDCTVWIERGLISPQGNEFVFIGTNPWVVDPSLAQSHVDLWSVKRNGEQRRWLGQHPELQIVKGLSVHPK